MALTCGVIPLMFRRDFIWRKAARVQPWLFGVGILFVSLGMTFAGSMGVPRRIHDIDQSGAFGAATREFEAKGWSHDGSAIGEWRQAWPEGEHEVVVEIVPGGTTPSVRWAGRIRAVPRRFQVIAYDAATGFQVE